MLRRITIAYTVNELGNWLGAVALAVAVFDHTRSAVATATLFISIRFLPALLSTPVVTWVEVFRRRGLLSALYWVQALTTGGLAVLVLHPVLAPILALAAVDGIAALVARALLRAVVSQEAGNDDARRRANGRLNIGWAAAGALGPAIGGALTGTVGATAVLLIDVGSFAITALLMLGVPTPATDASRGRVLAQVRDVGRYVAHSPTVGWLLGTEGLAMIFFAAVVPVEVVFAKATLHAGDAGYGALLAAWGAGLLVGGGIFARARSRPLTSLLTVSTLGVAVAYLGVAASTALWVACIFAFIGGTGNGVQWITLITAVQEGTPRGLQGRVMGVLESMAALSLALGFSLGGVVAAIWDPRVTFVMAGAASFVASCAFGRLTVRNRRLGVRRAGPGASEPAA